MNIEIKVTGLDNLAESIALLASAIGTHAGAQMKGLASSDYEAAAKQAVAQAVEAPKEEKPKAPAKAKAEKPKPAPVEEPAEEPTEELEPTDEPTPFDTDESVLPKEYSIEDVRAYLSPISRAGHSAKVKALIQKHGEADNLNEADPSTYGAIVEAAKALRVEIGMEV